MARDTLPRASLVGSALLVGALTAWAFVEGWPLPVRAYLLTATLVSAVGTSEVIDEVAAWYYVLQSAVLGLFGVGVILLGHGSLLVVGLTAAFGCSGLVFAARYRRARAAVPPSERDAP